MRGRKNYYNKASDMQRLPTKGTNGRPIWFKFLEKNLVEDCPICNPDLMLMYRLNPEQDDVVETNFEMTRKVEPGRRKINYRKNKTRYKTCQDHPVYDHEHHGFNTVKASRVGIDELTEEKKRGFVDKYGTSINTKMRFKKTPSNKKMLYSKSPRRYKNSKSMNPMGNTYARLHKSRNKKYHNHEKDQFMTKIK